MDEPANETPEANRCPACGSPLPVDALSCLSCGSVVVANVGASPAQDIPSSAQFTEPSPWQAPRNDSASAQPPAPLAPGEQRCQWCGEVSPADAEKCAHCQAAFPDPARDAAMLAEAQRRLTIIEQALDAKKRPRRFWGLLP